MKKPNKRTVKNSEFEVKINQGDEAYYLSNQDSLTELYEVEDSSILDDISYAYDVQQTLYNVVDHDI